MPDLVYLFRRVRNLNFDGMRARIDEAHQRSGKAKLAIFLDMANCALRYQAGYIDYVIFGMYDMNAKQRSQLLTRGKNNRYVAALNRKADWDKFEDKLKFHSIFHEEIGREYLDLSKADFETFAAFCRRHPTLIAKPVSGMCGKQVEKLTIGEDELKERYDSLRQSGQTLLEEVIEQHPVISSIHPHAINTIRVVTIVGDQGPKVVYTALRCGRGTSVVDNFNSGGMCVPIDPETGVIHNVAVDKAGNVYAEHPDTHVSFDGFAIPDWENCLAVVRRAATRIPGVRYVGWDIAVTPKGPVLVEGNHFPGHDIYQLKAQNPGKKGMMPIYESVVPYKSLEKLKD